MEHRREKRNGQNAVLLENDRLRVAVLPGLGGKVASLYCKQQQFELAAQPNTEYRRPGFGSSFAGFDASGLDDGFPCLHAYEDPLTGFSYPDHGEIWSASLSAQAKEDGIEMQYTSPHFPYRYSKRLSLAGNRLALRYTVENTGGVPFPCIWAFHGLLRYEEDMELFFPRGSHEVLNTLDSPQLGLPGQRHTLQGGYDFHHPPPAQPASMLKYYLAERMREGRCGVWYPGPGVGCLLRYNPTVLPYLGVWITAGGFRGDYNLALEPCNGFYDDIGTARQNNALYTLVPGRPLSFTLVLEIIHNKT